MSPSLGDEIKKRDPFSSVEQEAMLALLRTSDLLANRMSRLFREFGITLSQYNVLRILRGEGKPLPCLEIASRMIQVAPAITRTIDQLLELQMVTKTQSEVDRRVYTVDLTSEGAKLLKRMDQPVLDMHEELMRTIPKSDLYGLIRTLEKVRAGIP